MKLSTIMEHRSINIAALHKLRLPGGLISLALLILITGVHFFLPAFDERMGSIISNSLQGRGYFFFDKVTELGNISLILPAAFFLLLFLLWKRSWVRSIQLVLIVFGGAAFGYFLKLLYSQTRILSGSTLSTKLDLGFPSGHTMMALLFYGWFAYFALVTFKSTVWKWFAVLMGIFLIVSVGISRLMINVHLPSDVLSGWLAGSIWLVISSWLTAWIDEIIIPRIRNRFSPEEPFL